MFNEPNSNPRKRGGSDYVRIGPRHRSMPTDHSFTKLKFIDGKLIRTGKKKVKTGKSKNKRGMKFNMKPTVFEGKENKKWVKNYLDLAPIPEFKGPKSKNPTRKKRAFKDTKFQKSKRKMGGSATF